jgi:hypothetical protein
MKQELLTHLTKPKPIQNSFIIKVLQQALIT